MVSEEYVGIEEQVVKVHGSGFEQSFLVALVNFPHSRAKGSFVICLHKGVVLVGLPGDESIFCTRYSGKDYTRFVYLVVEAEFLHQSSDQGFGIVRIVNGEVGGVTEFVGFYSQDFSKYGVKGTHPGIPSLKSCQFFDAVLHFARRLVGKGEGKNVESIHSFGIDEVGNPVGQHSRLARTCTRNDHHGAFCMFYCLSLFGIKFLEVIHLCCIK